MTQILEKINVIAGTGGKWTCPFSHDADPKDYENDFIGHGKTLGDRLEHAQSTGRNPDYAASGLQQELDPKHRPGHAMNRAVDRLPIYLVYNDLRRPWPVKCAAHHLLPGGASLSKSNLVPWLVKKGTTANAGSKKGKMRPHTGLVLNNVGYDVNGAQNGVWVPGNYAMRGIWRDFSVDEEDDDPEEGASEAGEDLSPSSKFEYAVTAMRLANAQFHDAHEKPYSRFVLRALNAVAAKMKKIVEAPACEEGCKEKIEKFGPPPPYSLVLRMDAMAKRLRTLLEGGPLSWKPNIITSKFAMMYMNDPTYLPPNNS